MKKNRKLIIIILLLVVPMLAGALVVAMLHFTGEMAGKKVEEKDFTMFSAYTDAEPLQTVPMMETQGSVAKAEEYARDGYLVNVNGSTIEEYNKYLKTIEDAGFKKHSDNGEDAMEGNALSASFTKDDVTLTVSHAIHADHTYISAGKNVPLSDHLNYKDEYTKDIQQGAKTTMHLVELYTNGSSFVIQLKNGHFIIEDGGTTQDAVYLLEYLESLTPEGEKPVVEAWFITHPHSDHLGAMRKIATTPEYLNRITVEGFYYYDLSNTMLNFLKLQSGTTEQRDIMLYYRAFKTMAGTQTPLYRTQFGQRYYFCDITIDVSFTIEQCTRDVLENYDLNDSSTWLLHTIEGQRFLCPGDTNYSAQNTAMYLLDKSYFDLELFATPHHAINMYRDFLEILDVDTLIYTSFLAGSIWQDGTWRQAQTENDYVKQNVKEYYHYGDGTIVMTFPYNVGEAEKLPAQNWKYNGGMNGRDTIN